MASVDCSLSLVTRFLSRDTKSSTLFTNLCQTVVTEVYMFALEL